MKVLLVSLFSLLANLAALFSILFRWINSLGLGDIIDAFYYCPAKLLMPSAE